MTGRSEREVCGVIAGGMADTGAVECGDAVVGVARGGTVAVDCGDAAGSETYGGTVD